MSLSEYRIDAFSGIDQSAAEGMIPPGASPDACNMDTADGCLAVAKGYVKHIAAPVPGNKPIRRLLFWQGLVSGRFLAVAGNEVYSYTVTDASPSWKLMFTYPEAVKNLRVDFCEAQIGSADHLLLACGEHQIMKWDGVSSSMQVFGNAEKVSNLPVNYLAMHYGRLFAAGDPAHPCRLYWSKVPGDSRTIEDWAADPNNENSGGGFVEVGDTSGDPITGLCALSNQLLIWKRRSLYRLLGDRPGNYRVYRVHAEVEQMQDAACALYGDVPYWMTGAGLFFFDGQTAQKSLAARRIRTFLGGASTSNCRAAKRGETLYFTAYEKARDPMNLGSQRTMDNALIVYDIARQAYMIRRGFEISDLCAHDGALYLINDKRTVYRFEEGADYDGMPIDAYWNTPLTDLNSKPGIKNLQELYLRGAGMGGGEGAVLLLDARIGRNLHVYRCLMPENETEVLEIPLKNEGRTFRLQFSNEAGSRFRILGGVQLLFEHRLRAI